MGGNKVKTVPLKSHSHLPSGAMAAAAAKERVQQRVQAGSRALVASQRDLGGDIQE